MITALKPAGMVCTGENPATYFVSGDDSIYVMETVKRAMFLLEEINKKPDGIKEIDKTLECIENRIF